MDLRAFLQRHAELLRACRDGVCACCFRRTCPGRERVLARRATWNSGGVWRPPWPTSCDGGVATRKARAQDRASADAQRWARASRAFASPRYRALYRCVAHAGRRRHRRAISPVLRRRARARHRPHRMRGARAARICISPPWSARHDGARMHRRWAAKMTGGAAFASARPPTGRRSRPLLPSPWSAAVVPQTVCAASCGHARRAEAAPCAATRPSSPQAREEKSGRERPPPVGAAPGHAAAPAGSFTPLPVTHRVPHDLAQRVAGLWSVRAAHLVPCDRRASEWRARRTRHCLTRSEGWTPWLSSSPGPAASIGQASHASRPRDQRDPLRVRALPR